MQSISHQRRQLLLAGAGAVGLAASAAAFGQNTPRTLRVGYQKGWLSLLRTRATLEQRLTPLGVKVTWTEFNAGPVQLEALNVGSIDFGDVGEAPPIFAQAAGAPLAYAATTVAHPHQEGILVPATSTLRSVADLRGKRIALNKGSNVHYFLVKLLEKNGLSYNDIVPVFLAPPDARAAFEKGALDAWAIWDPFLSAAQHTLQARLLVDAEGVANNRQYYFSSRDYAARNPDVLKIAIEEIAAIDSWISTHQAAAAAELARVLGLEQPIIARYLSHVAFGIRPITPDILAEQQAIADTFLRLGLIPRPVQIGT